MRRLLCLVALLAQFAAAAPEPHYAGTLAGSPSGLLTAVDGPRLSAVFRAPRQAVVDAQGMVWVADTGNQLIRRMAADGTVSTLAGQMGVSGFADGAGATALFNEPSGVLPAPQGGVWVLDSNNGRIRHVAADGRVSTLAGGGQGANGSRHADGQGTAAAFNEPRGFAQDGAGNLYVADYQNQVIRRITPSGLVTTLAGSPGQQGSVDGTGSAARFSDPQAVALDSAGNLYVADTGPTKAIRKITPAGVVSTLLSAGPGTRLSEPRGLALLADGSLLIADAQEQQLLQRSPAGTVSVLVGQTGKPGLADGSGTAASLYTPMGLGAGPGGTVLVADSGNHLIRQLQGAQLSLWAGLPGHSAAVEGERNAVRFEDPFAVAVDAAGQAYLADAADHAIRRVDEAGRSSVWAGRPGSYGYTEGAAIAARFRKPAGLAAAADGTLYVADSGNHAVRRIAPDGQVSTLAGNGERGSRDGAGSAAQFNEPMGLALAPDGTLYVADFGNHLVRRVTAAGLVSTVAGSAGQGGFVDGAATTTARLRSPVDVAVGTQGQVYVLDRSNHAVRVLDAGQLSTLAGSGSAGFADGSGRSARFQFPTGLAAAPDGGLWVADTDNQRLRHVTPQGVVSSPLGLQAGRADGVGSAARFFNPKDVAAGADGRLLIVDRGNRSLRWAQALATGTTAIECLLDWGERSYPTLLQPPALSQDLAPYRYRAYAGALYVGVSAADQQVYLLQQGQLQGLGSLSGFLAQAGCQ
ncbi:hypothetical protein [Inhella proteolytica]|uniref:NHL repeat-containing protein n=1 Tax=Inhella proteolytica TaxID=2795029 RepID=A0A931NGS4_9BURK|nr:hypothetical protein [Inhella proteolytica]MBH9577008.1 hypothetical protein [Inhella proteolytica]